MRTNCQEQKAIIKRTQHSSLSPIALTFQMCELKIQARLEASLLKHGIDAIATYARSTKISLIFLNEVKREWGGQAELAQGILSV